MQWIKYAPVAWFAIGFILFVLEFLVPGLILFFFAIGAWIVALICFFTAISINMQLFIFLASSIITIAFFRKWAKRKIFSKKYISELEDEFVGKTAIAQTVIAPGKRGKVSFKGTLWEATSNETIQQGDTVIITGNESILLQVTPNTI